MNGEETKQGRGRQTKTNQDKGPMRWGHANLLCIVPSLTDADRVSPTVKALKSIYTHGTATPRKVMGHTFDSLSATGEIHRVARHPKLLGHTAGRERGAARRRGEALGANRSGRTARGEPLTCEATLAADSLWKSR